MKNMMCALSVLAIGAVLAVDWPDDVLTKIDAAEAAWPTAVTSSTHALASAVPAVTHRASGQLAVSCDTWMAWFFATGGMDFNSNLANGLWLRFR